MRLERVEFSGPITDHTYEQAPIAGPQPVEFDRNAVLDRFAGINKTFAIVRDPESRKKVETGAVNPEMLFEDAIGFISTNGSSFTQNSGNIKESGMRGASRPHVAEIYIAQPSMGGSSSMYLRDRVHLARTGRMTYGDQGGGYRPSKSYEAMARAIVAQYGVIPPHLSGDESAGRVGLGLMAAFEKDSIKDAYFNGLTGISKQVNYSAAMVREDREEAAKRNANSGESDVVTIDSFTSEEMKQHFPNIYNGLPHAVLLGKAWAKLLPNLAVHQFAFNGHQDLDKLDEHAAYQDMQAALQQQEAVITLQFNRQSRLHDIDDCIRFGKLVMDNMAPELHSDKRKVELLIGTGSLDAHTGEPAARAVSERLALSSIARFMMKVVYRSDDKGVFEPVFSKVPVAA